jgi:hypothetical protein
LIYRPLYHQSSGFGINFDDLAKSQDRTSVAEMEGAARPDVDACGI